MAIKLRGSRALGIVGFAALTVTLISACSGNGSAAGNSNGNTATATGTVAASNAGGNVSAGSGHSGATTTTAAVPVPVPARAASASVSTCLPVNLKFSLGNSRQMGQNQWAQAVDMTNRASAACTMDGFPGVDIIGDTDSQPSYDWTLGRSSANGVSRVTLRPGATAHFDLVYLSGDLASGGGNKNVIAVQRMVITTPGQPDLGDNTVQGSLDWAQSVVLQNDMSNPGTYIMPVVSGS